jgi:hypothetical protein
MLEAYLGPFVSQSFMSYTDAVSLSRGGTNVKFFARVARALARETKTRSDSGIAVVFGLHRPVAVPMQEFNLEPQPIV